ncbi:MAG: hypothetical protein MUP55_02425 [Candidatus Aenigmarchaeota archaeon]|nr:hypothetical protein [Candidatus Aenigmarchaeota archaeon]
MKISWIVALALIFVSVPTARAISPPDVTFIPSQISVNSSFLMLADPHPLTGEYPTVNWVIFGINEYSYGGTQKAGNKWICFFSKISDCTSILFPSPSYDVPYVMQVNAQLDPAHVENNTINVSVGGIAINTNIVITGANVYISAWSIPSKQETVGPISYKVYTSDTFDVIKNGIMTYNPNLWGYTTNITLQNGQYYIAFTANSASDFGGGVSRVVVGGGSTGSTDVKADSIVYSPVINPGQEFKIETFKITNLGTDNLTALSISVPQQISSYLTITPKKTFLEPNESTYMTVTLHNIQSSANISTFATLLSGSTEIKQIPVELRISVIGGINPESCVGKTDMTLCLGGICCGQICRTGGAQCCSSSDCPSGQTCSSDFKCTTSVTPGECEGKSDMETCTGGVCCSGSCITGGECCTDSDCSIGETCSYINICEAQPPDECDGKSEGASCSAGYCCSGYCQECCTSADCTGGKTCSDGICTGDIEPTPGGGIDIMTIALIGGGVAAAAVVGFFLFKKFRKRDGKEGEEDFEEGGDEKEEDEFSDEDFY